MKITTRLTSLAAGGALVFAGIAAPSVAMAAPAPASASQHANANVTKEKTVTDARHKYTVKYDASSKTFTSYRDGKKVISVTSDQLAAKLKQAATAAKEERKADCSGLNTVGIINGALWTVAGVAAPASAGATIAVAGFATTLIPAAGSYVVC